MKTTGPATSKLSRWLTFFTVEFIVAAVVFLLSVLLFATIANEAATGNEVSFDINVFNAMATYISPTATKVALAITFFGSAYFLIPVYLIIIGWFVKQRKYYYAVMVTVVALVSMLSGLILKEVFHRTRPTLPALTAATGYSFPSGHSLAGFTFCGVIIYIVWQSVSRPAVKWILTFLLVCFAAMVAFSRIYLRVHFASDVIGSLFVTGAWLSMSFVVFRAMLRKTVQ
jgi:undecaprenyl-diphosphatase